MSDKVFTIGIAGGSASGKSTLAEQIKQATGDAIVLSQDSFYFNHHDFPQHIDDPLNFDHSDAIDFGAMCRAIDQLKSGSSAQIPIYDFGTHLRTGQETISPAAILIIEGLFVIHMRPVRERLDFAVFVDVAEEIRYERRRKRDVEERERTADSVRTQWDQTVQPMFCEFIAPGISLANLVTDFADPAATVAKIVRMIGSSKQPESN